MKQSKGYRILAMIHGLISLLAASSMFMFRALDMETEVYAAMFVMIVAMVSAIIYDVMSDKLARREWRTIK
jgi:hypothetical protein